VSSCAAASPPAPQPALLPAARPSRRPPPAVGAPPSLLPPSPLICVSVSFVVAVLKADLIGFHTYDYARHFVSACTRILGLEGTPAGEAWVASLMGRGWTGVCEWA
jgi:hypothetical protein